MKIKRYISILVAVLMAFSAVPAVSAAENKVLLGDVNLDTKVNIRDVTLLQKYVANLTELSKTQLMAIDANGDTELNIKDATSLQKFIAGVEESEIIGVEITEAADSESTALSETDTTTEYTKATETEKATLATEESTWIELDTDPTVTAKASEATEVSTYTEIVTDPTETTKATEDTEVSTWIELDTDPTVTAKASEATEVSAYTEIVTDPTETTKATEDTEVSTWIELDTDPTVTAKASEATEVSTYTEIDTDPTETAKASEDTEVSTYTEIVTDPTETAKATETTVPAVTNENVGIFEGALSFSTLKRQRIDYYGSDETQLYLVRNMEELFAVHSGIIDEYGNSVYDDLILSQQFDSQYFAEKSLVVSFNCVGGSLSSQSIDSLRVEGDTLTVSRTYYQPFIDTCDMNYQYVLLEVDAKKVENVNVLRNASRVFRADENEQFSTSGIYEFEPITVYFTNSENWENVYIYYWVENYCPEWPGELMEFASINSYSQDVYKATIPGNIAGIVFSGGLNMPQTCDISENIKDGYGYYPTEFDGLRWMVESYVYIDDSISTTETKNNSDYDNAYVSHIPFSKVEECRVESYGSDNPEVHLVRSVSEYQAVLDKISGQEDGDYIRKPKLHEEYDDTYFEDHALVISLSCVGGSNCSQYIEDMFVEDGSLVLVRILHKPMNVTCDMNYQYVLLEVNSADINNVKETIDYTVECD